MEAKLIKMRDNGFLTYVLKRDDGRTIAMSRHPFPAESIMLAESHGIKLQKLSPENCDEIFGVVDIEKLAFEHSNDLGGRCSNRAHKSFKEGFNKAMELNKDKVFTLEDMKNAFYNGWNYRGEDYQYPKAIKEYLQHLQQPTEIEVVIETEEKYGYNLWTNPVEKEFSHLEPKFDLKGNLILKKL